MCEKLIRADALLETITKMAAEGFSAENVGRIIIAITDAPAVDAVEVVRCKDCEHYEKDTLSCGNILYNSCYQVPNWYENDFCSYGERKDNA